MACFHPWIWMCHSRIARTASSASSTAAIGAFSTRLNHTLCFCTGAHQGDAEAGFARCAAALGDRRDQQQARRLVEGVGGQHQHRAGAADFMSPGWIEAQLEDVAARGNATAHSSSRPTGRSRSNASSRRHLAGDPGLAARRSASVRRAGVTESVRPSSSSSTTEPASIAMDLAILFGIDRMIEPPDWRKVTSQDMVLSHVLLE